MSDYLDQSSQPQDPAPQPDYTQGEQKGWSFKPVDFATPKDPDSQLEDLYTNAQVEARAKKRAQDMSSMDAIQADYVASVKHSQEIQDRIDQTQKMLEGTPPPKPQAADLNTGEQLAAAIALLASHANPFATQQIMGASQKNADQRAGESNAYNQAVYEHHRAAMLGQLQDMLAQHKAETQHGYDLKDLGLQHQSRLEEIGAQGKNQQAAMQSRSLMMAGDRAQKTLDDEKSSTQGRDDAMRLLETLYYETGGQMGRLFSPEERAKNLSPNYHQANVEAGTTAKIAGANYADAKSRFMEGPQTDLFKARIAHYGDIHQKIQSEIQGMAVKNKYTQADTDFIYAKTAALPQELRYKGMHAAAAMLQAQKTGDEKNGKAAAATYARLLDQKLKQMSKAGKDWSGEWKDPQDEAEYNATVKEYYTAVGKANPNANPLTTRPPGRTDKEILDDANAQIAKGAPRDKVNARLKQWGLSLGGS